MIVAKAWLVVALLVAGGDDASPPQEDESSAGKPKLVVKEQEVDLGLIREGKKADAVFLLENHGDADLIISKVKGSCGCTTVKLTEEEKVIPPGGSQKVVTTFNSRNRPGKQTKSVTVYSNDPAEPRLPLKLTVEVVRLVQIMPGAHLNFRNARRGEQIVRDLRVLPVKAGGRLDIVSFEVSGGALTFTTEPIERGELSGYRMRFTVNQDAPLGELVATGELTVKVDEETETKKINIRG
ncbi:MAG: DUF1573 domain-containing protein, partial [Planctomycetota bacterium]